MQSLKNRPQTPHLLIYNLQKNSLFSIFNRITSCLLLLCISSFLSIQFFLFNFGIYYKFMYMLKNYLLSYWILKSICIYIIGLFCIHLILSISRKIFN
uniref:succinate:cytochrome c oxidoreductase subunit 3 n=1 Tax=Dixoniella grisea TaxID=35153 RepID=UPI001FCCF1BA|nr:succinate:cytochrome c oxidoreductase subunit 3 [Dixoniella grisea]UNJ18991.1 succinate:cytochrome c oxidoreductase subunit 3 [Dixoniella grisea]